MVVRGLSIAARLVAAHLDALHWDMRISTDKSASIRQRHWHRHLDL
jgi:hypothetical protein